MTTKSPPRFASAAPICARRAGAVAAALVVLMAAPAPALAQPVTNSSLYYRLGGGSPVSGPLNGKQTALRMGFSARLNYSCGKFDIGLSWSETMEGFKNLGTTVSNAVKAGISSLPLYILQRAQPGLYQLFQNFSAKADALVAASLKTCEDMEAMIKNGQDPYEDWVRMAKGDAWKEAASGNGNVISAKVSINKDERGQNNGVEWVFGTRAGGIGTRAIEPIRDLSIAGYNATVNQGPAASASTSHGTGPYGSTRLVLAFKSPEALAKWSTEVLGDRSIYLCSQTTCPQPTTTVTATGLGPKYETELEVVTPLLRDIISGAAEMSQVKGLASPGFGVSPQLIEAMRELSPESRSLAMGRVAQELAMHRVIDKALVVRSVLVTGLSLPQATRAAEMQKDVQQQIDRLTQYINDMMFEFRIRKEMSSDTALAIMGNQFFQDSQGTRVQGGRAPERLPMTDGRVKTN